jgi:hypothetical protein
MRARLALCIALPVFVSAACGGRLIENGNDYGGSTGTGGTSSDGATSSTGATSHRGGRAGVGGAVSTGGKATGGSFSNSSGTSAGGAVATAGAFSTGGRCACDPIFACPPGYLTVPNADGCCSHCESLCNNVMCPGIACASGSHLEQAPGQCCPNCVPDSCAVQQKSYQDFRQQLVDKYSSLGCMTNSDCTVYYEKNQCAVGCGIAMPSAALANLDGNLQSYAQNNCSPNCVIPTPPCDGNPTPICLHGLCE